MRRARLVYQIKGLIRQAMIREISKRPLHSLFDYVVADFCAVVFLQARSNSLQNLYGLAIDPTTGNLIGTEAPDFSAGGNLIFYDATGTAISSLTVGIGPNSAIYKN